MTTPRIALIHATPVAIEPIQSAFVRLWGEARVTNLLDDSLSADLAAAGALDERLIGRFTTLAGYAHGCGANAILFTCSAFGAAIEAVQAALPIPVLKPNEAMIDAAFAAGKRMALLVTFESALKPMCIELEQEAASRGIGIALDARFVPGALRALQAGKVEEHDRLIAQTAAQCGPRDAIVLGQFSMACAAARVREATGLRVLTSPDSAVAKLKHLLAPAAA